MLSDTLSEIKNLDNVKIQKIVENIGNMIKEFLQDFAALRIPLKIEIRLYYWMQQLQQH